MVEEDSIMVFDNHEEEPEQRPAAHSNHIKMKSHTYGEAGL